MVNAIFRRYNKVKHTSKIARSRERLSDKLMKESYRILTLEETFSLVTPPVDLNRTRAFSQENNLMALVNESRWGSDAKI